MTIAINVKTLLAILFLYLLSYKTTSGQGLDVVGTAKAGSYQMGTVKMVPAGSGFASIRFENESEILAEFNASVGLEPPALKIGQVKIGDLSILNPSGFPKHLFFNEGGTTLFALNESESSMSTDNFRLFGLFSVSQGVRIAQNVAPFSAWQMSVAPGTGTLEFFLDGVLKARINTSGTYSALSDLRAKTAIRPLGTTLRKVLKLEAKSYAFKDAISASRSIGFISQQVATLFPELVQGDPGGEDVLTLNYSDFGVLAIKAIQEQQATINSLEQRLTDLEARLNE